MEYSNPKSLSRSKLWDSFSGAVGGVIGTLLLNLVFPQIEGLYLALVYLLPGFILGAVIGYFLSGKLGRGPRQSSAELSPSCLFYSLYF